MKVSIYMHNFFLFREDLPLYLRPFHALNQSHLDYLGQSSLKSVDYELSSHLQNSFTVTV